MITHGDAPLISTVRERCRVCFTCVRECPAKAIRISGGQAEVLSERCVGCGSCVRVCSQGAKQVLEEIGRTERLLTSGVKVVAALAPSFPAEFDEVSPEVLVGMIRACGFSYVSEVGFGADLVATQYHDLVQKAGPDDHYIATNCPAVVAYVERYHPALVPHLAPIVSPMVATARALKLLYGPEIKVVFIGPCIAKKAEASDQNVADEVDAVLTFQELRSFFLRRQVSAANVMPSDFDPPYSGSGAIFPLSRGMLQSAKISEDLTAGQVVATTGPRSFIEALREFEAGAMDVKLLELLSCNGCIMGPGMTSRTNRLSRRASVSRYVRDLHDRRAAQDEPHGLSGEDWQKLTTLDLSRGYQANDQRLQEPSARDVDAILKRMGKHWASDELNCGACGYDTCREHAKAIFLNLAESEMCLPYTIDQLRSTVGELARSHQQLADTQEALMHSERLASMGQLAAGIAHEVNNPLGVVLMYAHLLLEDMPQDSRMTGDLKMIAEQADRCKRIVAGLLDFARQNKVIFEPTDVRDLVQRSLNAAPPPAGITVEVTNRADSPVVDLDREQMTQVLINLMTNAYQAMPTGGRLTITTLGDPERMQFVVSDTGAGIAKENLKRIYQPFFTTKGLGRGTGLGLAVSYGIIKMHRGDIRVESNADPSNGPTGTSFTVSLPRVGMQE